MGKNLLNTNYVKEATEKWLSNIVIPQVYDDSLSYYEEINKLIGCLNEMGNAFETLPDAVQEILQDPDKRRSMAVCDSFRCGCCDFYSVLQ